MKKPEITTKETHGRKIVSYFDPTSTPSWKRFGEGTCDAEFAVHKQGAAWLEIKITETSKGEKRDTVKTVYATLDSEGAAALRDMLVGAFPE